MKQNMHFWGGGDTNIKRLGWAVEDLGLGKFYLMFRKSFYYLVNAILHYSYCDSVYAKI